MFRRKIVVKAIWDEEAKVWVAESDDVPGLITEAETADELLKKLPVLIQELRAPVQQTSRRRKEPGFMLDLEPQHYATA